MAPKERAVKSRRPYDSTRRREQAGETRRRIIDVAERRFLADGYAATSIASIAADALVSVDTIYKSFGGKAGLVRAIHERALQGTGPEPAESRSDRLQAEEADPAKIIAGWGRFVTEIAPRGSPLLLLVRAAAANDPELVLLLDEIDAERLERMTLNAERLYRAGHLRPGVTVGHAADVLWTYSSAELYELLVIKRGMSIRRYGKFVADAMIAALLPPQAD
jgi:AcrR family transcriptional regulator